MSLDESAASNLNGNSRNLGTIWLAYGIYRVIVGICLVLFSGTATVMFGTLLAVFSEFWLVWLF
jgi:hypothetical protein